MQEVADELTTVLSETVPVLEALSEDESGKGRGPDKWSGKEILGHLIDSALNNVHRFVRAQQGSELVFPAYEQRFWVATSRHQERPWRSLITLWKELNEHVAHVVSRIPAERLATPCRIGDGPPVTLEFIARDYVTHLRHHLQQILAG
jgi:DinB family protein